MCKSDRLVSASQGDEMCSLLTGGLTVSAGVPEPAEHLGRARLGELGPQVLQRAPGWSFPAEKVCRSC